MNKYLQKDINKFSVCNKIITRGSSGSSSDLYRNPKILKLPKDTPINDTKYVKSDIVGVSINGARHDRISFDKQLVDMVIQSGATIVKDNRYRCIEDNNIRSVWRPR